MVMMRRNPLRWALAATMMVMLVFLFHHHHGGPYASLENPLSAFEKTPFRSHSLDNVFNTTLGFEKILVVSLPFRTDRRDSITLQAAVSNIEIEFTDGVSGESVPKKAIPSDDEEDHLAAANVGSWRGHMNAVQEIVRRNLSSALILEDDVDWDIRLKEQLRDFALSTRSLIQPLAASPASYADPTYPSPPQQDSSDHLDIDFNSTPKTVEPTCSPYGDGWDVLWIGHCSLSFPFDTSERIPKGRVIHHDDVTVPPKKNLWSLNSPFVLVEDYPEHTRAVSHAQEGLCTLGYAVSQAGARKLLADTALKPPKDAFDFLLRFFCDGTHGRNHHNCLGVQPALFNLFKPAGPVSAESDIGPPREGFRHESSSEMVRWSVRLNLDQLMEGRADFVDQYPDDNEQQPG